MESDHKNNNIMHPVISDTVIFCHKQNGMFTFSKQLRESEPQDCLHPSSVEFSHSLTLHQLEENTHDLYIKIQCCKYHSIWHGSCLEAGI
jgi:hypothetical protein